MINNLLKLVFFALVLMGGFLLFKHYENTQNKGERASIKSEDLKPLACDLNQKACEYEFAGRRVSVEFKTKPLRILDENKLVIKNLGDMKDLNARIYALNMYMGEIIPKFKKLSQNDYEANIVISTCILDTMRYRIEFFEGEKPLNFYFDFDVKK